MEQETVHFGENGIIKSVFHKNKNPININELDIKRIALSDKKSYGEVYTNIQHNEIPKDNKYCVCLSIILLYSIFFSIQIKNIIHRYS